ncbi:MAG: hypothetical protein COX79_04320 [Candidatus Levybacteria bacterium CG_4_10_14_0_2_um_filter_36_16]|nr:MAG: hypothetical protein AUK12_02240 [Candidatus Levybacteria bacterium CG2_30_37_29]PIR79131.1 MAG: hypothetical protein COU26_02735 [Candidatus Levybacteria bacterium CG10_big_fil_rev_8_21_14_0_10_36_30]PIZ96793.1 MAG: hypothetical protein COX79_04320 [Candidatus Levybacteria bacterium CG_4_10_14_0_2_um_filter_36_16]
MKKQFSFLLMLSLIIFSFSFLLPAFKNISNVIIILPLVFLSIYSKPLRLAFVTITTSFTLIGLFLLILKLSKNIFPIYSIESNKIVSFVHYEGYPQYYDLIGFSIFIVFPVIVILLLKYIFIRK